MKSESPPPEPTTFAEVVADADARKLALAAGISVNSVYNWKRGRCLPGLDIIDGVAKALGWSTAKLTQLVIDEQTARKKARRHVTSASAHEIIGSDSTEIS
jgi:transcriptional regulator with XRE-family HTH domain